MRLVSVPFSGTKEMESELKATRIFRRRTRGALASGVAVLVGTLLIAGSSVLAFNPGPGTGAASPYNASDATPDCLPSAGYLDKTIGTGAGQNPPQGTADCTTPTGAPIHWITDTVSGSATDNAWGQGDKSDCFLAKTGGVAGACSTMVFGIGASKTDLQYHGIGIANATATVNGVPVTHSYLYSGIKRLLAGGISSSNANYAVEVNQDGAAYQPAAPICADLATSGGTGGCNMWRTPGDLLLMTDWGGANSSCTNFTPAICGYVWIDFSTGTGKTPSPSGSTCFNAKAAPCWGLPPGGAADLTSNPDKAAGSIDSATSTFTEIGVDLTQSGLIPPGACETFNDVWAHSRSSSSFTAELKDFIFGHVSISTCTTTVTSLQQTNSDGTVNIGSPGLELTVNPGAYVEDTATVTNSTGVTGSVDFRLYPAATGSDPAATCKADTTGTGGTDISTNTLSGNPATATSSPPTQFNTVGDFYWRAFYIPGNLSASFSACNEIVHVIQVETAISTSPFYYPNDSATLSAPNGGGTLAGSIDFKAYVATTSPAASALANCTANGTQGLLFTEPTQTVSGVGPYSTHNTTNAVSATGQVYFRVTFTSTNAAQKGRNSVCVENINATLTGDSPGTSGNTP